MEVAVCIVIAFIALIYLSAYNRKKRREALLLKYRDEQLVDMIMDRKIWQGQTSEQLLDSRGKPMDIDERVFKTKIKQTWKYNQTGKNRFQLRVTLENRVVVGWDQK